MTERSGGSDVRGTETVATAIEHSDGALDAHGDLLGPYKVSGFKWFSSATDSNMTVLLAQTPKGLSAFMAPMQRAQQHGQKSELNGITIQRLKPKMGTIPVPTAELVLTDTRAWLIGNEGAGVREIATVLNITRVYTGLGSLGYWGRGLAIARAFARVRKVDGGKPLKDMPAHLKTMARNTVNYAAMMHLGFFTVSLLGITEHPDSFNSGHSNNLIKDGPEATALLRLLTAVMKAQCSKMAIHGLQEAMEALGGLGYLEDEQEYNVARLFRDCNVNSIWEGTTDVMAWDVVRVMKGREGPGIQESFKAWAERHADAWVGDRTWRDVGSTLKARVGAFCQSWASQDADQLKYRGRQLLEELAWIVATISMVTDAVRDPDAVAVEVAKRWAHGFDPKTSKLSVADWREESNMDRRIVFLDNAAAAPARL